MIVKAYSAPKDPGSVKKTPDTKQARIPTGIPKASVLVARGDAVSILVRWHDCYDIPETLCAVHMSPTEALALGERLIAEATAHAHTKE